MGLRDLDLGIWALGFIGVRTSDLGLGLCKAQAEIIRIDRVWVGFMSGCLKTTVLVCFHLICLEDPPEVRHACSRV